MAVLLDLSNELLLEIVSQFQAQLTTKRTGISDISTTCKRLNACCDRWIFKKYKLSFRDKNLRFYSSTLTALKNPDTFWSWNLDAVKARLNHLRDKAPFIKKLTIQLEDQKGRVGADTGSDQLVFTISNVLQALKGANQIKSITISSDDDDDGVLPLPLWEWITMKELTMLAILSPLVPPPDAMVHTRVHQFEGRLFNNSMPFLKVRTDSRNIIFVADIS